MIMKETPSGCDTAQVEGAIAPEEEDMAILDSEIDVAAEASKIEENSLANRVTKRKKGTGRKRITSSGHNWKNYQ